jgi:hypothetical protein
MSSLHDFSGVLNGGGKVDFSRYAGHPCLVVNVASEWGVTDAEYKALTKLIDDVSKQNNFPVFPINILWLSKFENFLIMNRFSEIYKKRHFWSVRTRLLSLETLKKGERGTKYLRESFWMFFVKSFQILK